MRKLRRSAAVVVGGAVALAACGATRTPDVDGDGGIVDAGGDALDDDAEVDAARDAAMDAAIDAAIDAAVDAMVDAPVNPCANGVRDAAETDVDCGGGTCEACPVGEGCAVDGDCANGNCVAMTCAAAAAVSFAAPVYYASGYKPYFVRAGELDGDGDLDLVVGNEQASAVAVFRNSGSGTFTRIGEFATGAYPTGGAIVDLDDDGVADVITADYRGDSVSVLIGAGGGVLGAPASYPTVDGGETSNLAVGDLDGDGRVDVIATNPQTASASVFLGGAGGALTAAPTLSYGAVGTAEPYSAAIGDFDRDGKNDVAVADDRTARVLVRRGNGDGTFGASAAFAIGGIRSHIMLAHDMNRDGLVDLVIANRNSDDVSVLRGRGDGGFQAAIVSSTGAGTGPYSLAIADFDLDGVPDVVTANFITSTASILLGRGDGGFEAAVSAGVVGGFSYGVAAGDFNGDGKPDFAIANAVADNLAVVINTSE